VLGLLERAGEATPYELKRQVAAGIGNFWSLQHAQLYTETERLARAGYLEETRERAGRRRKRYRPTDAGREALHAWRIETTDELPELRDVALLKLFFDATPGPLAEAQLAAHEAKLAEYLTLQAEFGDHDATGPSLTLEAGIRHEREWVNYWRPLTVAASRERENEAGG
jgi:PadR family transcriptional regulator AphA